MHLSQAGQLTRTVAHLAETLDRRRNGGRPVANTTMTQRIIVERVVSGTLTPPEEGEEASDDVQLPGK
jgi:hypothetical protein